MVFFVIKNYIFLVYVIKSYIFASLITLNKRIMNHEEYLLNEAYERNETPLNDHLPTMYYVLCNGDEIVFTTNDFTEAVQEYSRVVLLNESGESDDYAVDLMSCDGDYFNVKEVIKTLGYSDSIKSWTRN